MKRLSLASVWNFCSSLKLAIVLASLATLLGMAGSLVIHAHPELFGNLDSLPLGAWLRWSAFRRPDLTWWLWLAGLLLILLGLNTLCCFLDWLWRIRLRWRKTGEYLIHAGFVLVLAAYLWGSLAGFRHDQTRIFVDEPFRLEEMPGTELRLADVRPLPDAQGRPLDLLNRISLWQNDRQLAQGEVRLNHPLTYRGLVVVPVSLGQEVQGYRCFQPGRGILEMLPGRRYEFPGETELRVLAFLPDAVRGADGQVLPRSRQPVNPALRLELLRAGQNVWSGWYLLRESLPFALVANGLQFWPTDPIVNRFSILTVNYDPGAGLALWGGGLILAGVILAVFSFYRKRRRKDRPDIP